MALSKIAGEALDRAGTVTFASVSTTGNVVVNATITAANVTVGNVVINNTAVTIGANAYVNSTSFYVGNSTVFSIIQSNSMRVGGSLVANGGYGSAGHVLTSGGTSGHAYWAPASGSGASLTANNTDTQTYYVPMSFLSSGAWANAVVPTVVTYVPSTRTLSLSASNSRLVVGDASSNVTINTSSISINGNIVSVGGGGGGSLPSSFSVQNTTGTATAIGANAFAIGVTANAYGEGSISLGVGSTSAGRWSTVVGYGAKVNAANSVAVGVNANAQLTNAVAIGANATTYGYDALAVGAGSFANGNYSLSLGSMSQSNNIGLAIGQYARATGSMSVAVGQYSNAYNYRSVAIGQGANATGYDSVAIGPGSSATADYRITLGHSSHDVMIPGSLMLINDLQAAGSFGSYGQVLTSAGEGSGVFWSSSGGGGFSNGSNITVGNLTLQGTLTANNSQGSPGQILYSSGMGTYWGAAPSGSSSGGSSSSSAGKFKALMGPTSVSLTGSVTSITGPTASGKVFGRFSTYPVPMYNVVSMTGGQFNQVMGSYSSYWGPDGPTYPWVSANPGSSMQIDIITDGSAGQFAGQLYVLEPSTDPNFMTCFSCDTFGNTSDGTFMAVNGPMNQYGQWTANPDYFYGMIMSQSGPADFTNFQPAPGVSFYFDTSLQLAFFNMPGSIWLTGGTIGTLAGFSGGYVISGYYFGS